MYLSFREKFDLPISKVFPYFKSPSEWGKLYGIVKPIKKLENGSTDQQANAHLNDLLVVRPELHQWISKD